ncbi:ABC transporter permease [Frondihabitans sucicola]|uniref:ABC transporter permease n=1 Tax=Frondihabitans sucicola TaxID=1268041 RepID=A0ABM8GNE4_9MICO|nr:ECF transporter S component [Frondihabitans sucicola]BDZ49942.1 ABC transporter permease [Frondihabitans sucicola]
MSTSVDHSGTSTSPRSRTSDRPAPRRWRVVDIVVASVLGVASGVIFWLWDGAWTPLSGLLSFTPGFEGLLTGGWLFAGVLGGLVIRKPGAALYTEILAAVVEMLAGNQFGFSSLPWGILEGLGAEIVFAIFLYRRFNLGVALLAGAVAGLAAGLLDTSFSGQAGYAVEFKLVYIVSAIVSGAVIGGLLSWLAVRGLAGTGALSRFASGRATQNRV